MRNLTLFHPTAIRTFLFLQFIPFILFPLESYSATSQEWWLPVLLALLCVVAVFQITVRRSLVNWPWYLISFAQGFNIISRLMLLMPHSTRIIDGVQHFNIPYVVLTLLSITLSMFALWYAEKPDVRMGLIRGK